MFLIRSHTEDQIVFKLGFFDEISFLVRSSFHFSNMNDTFQKMSLNDFNSLGAAEREIEKENLYIRYETV